MSDQAYRDFWLSPPGMIRWAGFCVEPGGGIRHYIPKRLSEMAATDAEVAAARDWVWSWLEHLKAEAAAWSAA